MGPTEKQSINCRRWHDTTHILAQDGTHVHCLYICVHEINYDFFFSLLHLFLLLLNINFLSKDWKYVSWCKWINININIKYNNIIIFIFLAWFRRDNNWNSQSYWWKWSIEKKIGWIKSRFQEKYERSRWILLFLLRYIFYFNWSLNRQKRERQVLVIISRV